MSRATERFKTNYGASNNTSTSLPSFVTPPPMFGLGSELASNAMSSSIETPKFELSAFDTIIEDSNLKNKTLADTLVKNRVKIDGGDEETEGGGFFSSLTGDNSFGANVSGLASAFASLVSLPQMLKNAKLNYAINKTGFRDAQEDRTRFLEKIKDINTPIEKDDRMA